MKSPTRLAAATGAVVAALTFGATAALAGGGSSGDDLSLLRAPVQGSQLSDPPLFGATRGGAPWVISEGQARLSSMGELRVEVEGLVIPGRGNPVPALSASVACNGMIVATTPTVRFNAAGDARIRTHVMLPGRCLAPAVLLNPNGNAAVYIAATGR